MTLACLAFFMCLGLTPVLCVNKHLDFTFSLVKDSKVESGIALLQTFNIPGVSAIQCGALCGDGCGSFQVCMNCGLCEIFETKWYDSGVILGSNTAWTVGYKQYRTVEDGNWILAFRAQNAIGSPVYDFYDSTGNSDDNPILETFPTACLRFNDYETCDRHFRSHILDDWSNIAFVKFSLYKSDIEVAFAVFNGSQTDRESWFSVAGIINSTWAPAILNEVGTLVAPGVSGDPQSVYDGRFYLHGPYYGCTTDWVYTVIADNTGWCFDYEYDVKFTGVPTILYSPVPGRSGMMFDGEYPTVEVADVMAVWVQYA